VDGKIYAHGMVRRDGRTAAFDPRFHRAPLVIGAVVGAVFGCEVNFYTADLGAEVTERSENETGGTRAERVVIIDQVVGMNQDLHDTPLR
jgi:hypothetical protein